MNESLTKEELAFVQGGGFYRISDLTFDFIASHWLRHIERNGLSTVQFLDHLVVGLPAVAHVDASPLRVNTLLCYSELLRLTLQDRKWQSAQEIVETIIREARVLMKTTTEEALVRDS